MIYAFKRHMGSYEIIITAESLSIDFEPKRTISRPLIAPEYWDIGFSIFNESRAIDLCATEYVARNNLIWLRWPARHCVRGFKLAELGVAWLREWLARKILCGVWRVLKLSSFSRFI